jgi:hypothetical protein
MTGRLEGEDEIESALRGLYFDCESNGHLLGPCYDFEELYKLCDGRNFQQRQDYAYLSASLLGRAQELKAQDVDYKYSTRSAEELFLQAFQALMIESHHCTPQLEQQANAIGKSGFESLLRKMYYSKESKSSFDDFKKKIDSLRSGIKSPTNCSVAGPEFVSASKTVRGPIVNGEKKSTTTGFFHKRPLSEVTTLDEENDEKKENDLAGSKEASIQSTFSYYGMNQNKIPQSLTKKPPKPKPPSSENNCKEESNTDERLVGIDPKLVELITSEVSFPK